MLGFHAINKWKSVCFNGIQWDFMGFTDFIRGRMRVFIAMRFGNKWWINLPASHPANPMEMVSYKAELFRLVWRVGDLPGNLLHSYWTWPSLNINICYNIPMKDGDFHWFSIAMLVSWRVPPSRVLHLSDQQQVRQSVGARLISIGLWETKSLLSRMAVDETHSLRHWE